MAEQRFSSIPHIIDNSIEGQKTLWRNAADGGLVVSRAL